MAELSAPVTARGPWLTAVLNEGSAHRFAGRPVAVVVEPHRQGRPEAVAFLTLRRRGLTTAVTVLGAGGGPAPAGPPAARLLAPGGRAGERLPPGIPRPLGAPRGRPRVHVAGAP